MIYRDRGPTQSMTSGKKLIPEGVPSSPPYADAFVGHKRDGVLTLYLMRLPPDFSGGHGAGDQELRAPVVGGVTISEASAKNLADLIYELLERPKGE